jgi:hypothetical protein
VIASPPVPSLGDRFAVPLAGALAALAVFAPALCLLDAGPGGGFGGDVAAGAVRLGPSHAPGQPLHSLLSRAAAFLPIGSHGFRVRLFGAACLALAAGLAAALAARLARRVAGGGAFLPALLGLGAGLMAGLSVPFQVALGSADSAPLRILAGVAVLYGAVGALLESPDRVDAAFGGLLGSAFALGLAVADHPPAALPLLPPFVLAAALVLARHPRRAGAAGEPIVATRVSWVVAAGIAALLALFVLPIRFDVPLGVSTLLEHLTARGPLAALDVDPVPPGWIAPLDVGAASLRLLPVAATLAGGMAVVALVAARALRPAGGALAAFLLAPTAVRAGMGFDRTPEEALPYLAVPAVVLAVALVAPFALALRVALRRGWRPRALWAAAALLVFAALVRDRIRSFDPGEARARFAAIAAAADAVAETPPPGAVLVVARPAVASLLRYDAASAARRPDLVLVEVPRLGDPAYVHRLLADHPDLAPLVSVYLGPAELPPSLGVSVERLAARAPLYAEPGRLVDALAPRSLFPRGPLIEILGDPVGRTGLSDRVRAVAGHPARPGDRLTPVRGTAVAGALAWDLARSAVHALRLAAAVPAAGREERDPREDLRRDARALLREASAAGAPVPAVLRMQPLFEAAGLAGPDRPSADPGP